jgi:hypothetical protein
MAYVLLYFELAGYLLGLLQVVEDAIVVLFHLLYAALLISDFLHLAHMDAVVALTLLEGGLALAVQGTHAQRQHSFIY